MTLGLVVAAVIYFQTLPDADVLEPSIRNEVMHALSRSAGKSSFTAIAEFEKQLKLVAPAKGLSATDVALKFVTSQKSDGRWFVSGTNDVTSAARYELKKTAGISPPPRIAVFADHVKTIARQRSITLHEAASFVKKLGIEGVEASFASKDDIKVYRQAGLEIACLVWFANFDKSYDGAMARKVVDTAVENACRTVHVVPAVGSGSIESGDSRLRTAIIDRTENFARLALAEGVDVCVENFDNPLSLLRNTANMLDFIRRAPSVGVVFDSGNFHFAGEDAMGALRQVAGRVKHVHLKDRDGTGSCAPFGSGVLPAEDLASAPVKLWGYEGWYTIEHYGMKDMSSAVTSSISFLKSLMLPADAGGGFHNRPNKTDRRTP